MVECVLIQLKPSDLYIISFEKGLGLRPRPFSTAKNVELFGLYPIQNATGSVAPHPQPTAVCFN